MNRKLKTFAISTAIVLWVGVSLVEANWTMNYPMNGSTLSSSDTPGTGNTPQEALTVTYRIGKYVNDRWVEYGSVTGPNESFGGWYLTIGYTTPGTGLRAELLESGIMRVGCDNLTVE